MFVAIIQARMGSTRLPGKVMKKVLGKPLIEYLLERVSKSKYIDKIILATTTNNEDDILSNYVSSLGYDVFRGSENDVLERYYKAYKTLDSKLNIEGIIRITGDCPLFEAEICDRLINMYIEQELDFAFLQETFAEGLDCSIFSINLLEKAFNYAKLQSEREHVTLYFHNHKQEFKLANLVNITDDSKYRITVDEEKDFIVVESIIKYFNKNKNMEININNIKKYLNQNKELFSLNSSIQRNEGLIKSLNTDIILK